jgi:hypothetical protein
LASVALAMTLNEIIDEPFLKSYRHAINDKQTAVA